jgi:hypothetical protein
MKNRSRSSGKMRRGALGALFAVTKRRGIWFSILLRRNSRRTVYRTRN